MVLSEDKVIAVAMVCLAFQSRFQRGRAGERAVVGAVSRRDRVKFKTRTEIITVSVPEITAANTAVCHNKIAIQGPILAKIFPRVGKLFDNGYRLGRLYTTYRHFLFTKYQASRPSSAKLPDRHSAPPLYQLPEGTRNTYSPDRVDCRTWGLRARKVL